MAKVIVMTMVWGRKMTYFFPQQVINQLPAKRFKTILIYA
jgi:hypothetical protein